MEEEFNHWEQVADEIDQRVGQLVRVTAFKVEAGAKRRAPVDTGFLRNSIYTVTNVDSGAAGSIEKAIARRFKAKRNRVGKNIMRNIQRLNAITEENLARKAAVAQQLFPEVGAPAHNEALVAVGAVYGWFVEYGTSHMGARPFLIPAMESVRSSFLRALHQLVNGDFTASGVIE